jgi:hypothetical protein
MALFPNSPQIFINSSPHETNGAWTSVSQQYAGGYQPGNYGQQIQFQGQYNPIGDAKQYQLGHQMQMQQHVQSMYQTELIPQMHNMMEMEMIPMRMVQTEIFPQMQTMFQTEMIPMQVQEIQTIMVQEPVVEMVPVPVQGQQVFSLL